MFSQFIGKIGQYDITDGDETYISCVEFTVYGFTGSMVPQTKQSTDGSAVPAAPNYFNAAYLNANTGVLYAAGTAITADGRYIIDTTGAVLSLNVTDAGDLSAYVYGKPFLGPGPAGSASSGGGAVTGQVAINDGTTTTRLATVKAASAGAVATDTALVVAISPNNAVEIANDSGNPIPVSGASADNSTNSTAKVPVLIGVAQTGAPAITVGRQVPAYVDQVTGGVFIYDVTPITAAIPIRFGAPVANDWAYVAASGGITTTTAVTIKAAGGGSVKNYVTSLQMFNSGAAGTEVIINSGAAGTPIWRGYVGATSAATTVVFQNPLQSAANTLLEVVLSSGVTVAVRFNAQGYSL